MLNERPKHKESDAASVIKSDGEGSNKEKSGSNASMSQTLSLPTNSPKGKITAEMLNREIGTERETFDSVSEVKPNKINFFTTAPTYPIG